MRTSRRSGRQRMKNLIFFFMLNLWSGLNQWQNGFIAVRLEMYTYYGFIQWAIMHKESIYSSAKLAHCLCCWINCEFICSASILRKNGLLFIQATCKFAYTSQLPVSMFMLWGTFMLVVGDELLNDAIFDTKMTILK